MSSVKSYGQTFEEECYYAGVLRDGGDAPANLACQLNGHVVPCDSCISAANGQFWDFWSNYQSCFVLFMG